jgi:uncharacterized membrane protein
VLNGRYSLSLTEPWFLAVLGLVPLLVWYHHRSLVDFSRRQRLLSLLCRLLMLILVVLALCGLVLVWPCGDRFVVFLLDDSLSVGDESRKTAEAFVDQALRHRGRHDAAFLSFAAAPGKLLRERAAPVPRADDDEAYLATNFEAALDAAAAGIPPGFVPHLVLCSDGNQTAGDALAAALRLGLPISTVPLPVRDEPEVQLSEIRVPDQVRAGESFEVVVVVTSNRDGEARLELWNNRDPVPGVREERRKIVKGDNFFRFRQKLGDDKLAVYKAHITPYFEDTLQDNNTASALVFCSGKPQVLILDSDERQIEPFANVLRGQNFLVDVLPPEGLPKDIAGLERYDLVVLSNVPATKLPLQSQRLLRTYVRDLGGGLMVLGGSQSFSLGGYSRSLLADLLPVESSFPRDKESPNLALVLIIDKSGSMQENQKIVIARDAARGAVDLLSPKDHIGVIAFNSEFEWVSKLGLATDKALVNGRIDTIDAAGGTTIYPSIQAAFEALQAVGPRAKFKHVILLTDGMDEPQVKTTAEYVELASRMKTAGIKLTTVAVGPDADRKLLEQVAHSGGGNFYPADDPNTVPQIFAKETAEASGEALQNRSFSPVLLKPTPALAGIDWHDPPFLGGYVQTRIKPQTEQILITDRGAPLLAWMRYGLGWSVAFTSSPRADWSDEWINGASDVYARFWSQVARQALRKNDARGVELRLQPRGRETEVIVDAVDARGRFLNDAAVEIAVIDSQGPRDPQVLKQAAPGRYTGRFDSHLADEYLVRVRVQPANSSPEIQLTRGLSVGYPEELRFRPTNEGLLRSLAEASGGTYQPTPEAIFADDGRTAERLTPLWPYLIALAIALLLPDVALRRLQWGRRPPLRSAAAQPPPLASQETKKSLRIG